MSNSPKLKVINGHAYANSHDLARKFGKDHKNVLRAIESRIADCSEAFNRLNFEPITYTDRRNREQPAYNLTKDGFSMIAFAFTGSLAAKFTEEHLNEFNRLERELRAAKTRIETLENLEMFPDMLREREFTIAEVLERVASVGLYTLRTTAGRIKSQIKRGESLDGSMAVIGSYMNEKQIKRHFEDCGLRISDVAKTMQEDFPGITLNSADVMLRQLIAGARWYPIYAKWLKSKFGVTVDQPAWVPGVRERMRRLAA